MRVNGRGHGWKSWRNSRDRVIMCIVVVLLNEPINVVMCERAETKTW